MTESEQSCTTSLKYVHSSFWVMPKI